ncbi:MAG: aminotransferase [Gammaproteobacteria bacterium]|nr:aminotransferase [Gammaproteobacteria bacterium]
MSDMSNNAKELWEMDKDHVVHPYTNFSQQGTEGSQVIVSAEGAYINDAAGNKLLDGIGGLWCVNIGHGRKEMADAIHAQIMEMQYYNPFGHTTNVPATKLAKKLAELTPGKLNHVFFVLGGSEANDAAIRFVHYYNNLRGKPAKKKIISRIDAYHGATYLVANLTGIQGTKIGFDNITGDLIHHVSAANMYRRPPGAENLDEAGFCDFLVNEFENRILQLGADNVAAFIAEPLMGAGGVLVAPKGYHKRMHAICKKYDMLYIADEVVTGFGRLGQMFASEAIYDYTPDILCIAKGLTSAYMPLGATIISEEVHKVISESQEDGALAMGYTYTAHASSCAAALKNIEIIEREGLCEHVREMGPYLENKAKELLDLPLVGDVRGSHFMLGIELVADKKSKESFDPSVGITNRVFKYGLERGIVVRPVGNTIVLSPPLILTQEQCDTLIDVLKECISLTASDVQDEGLIAA